MPNSRRPDRIYTVSQLTGEMRNLLETSYRNVWIEGEISGLARPASGHLYFSLKESNALIRCAFFKNRQMRGSQPPKDGDQMLVQGQISVYEARGDLQMIVTFMEAAGEGALRRAFELLKKQLSVEGLFEQEHKKTLPELPTSIGIITSESGAVLQDIITTVSRRMPSTRLVVYPSRVQGDGSAEEIVSMIQLANERAETDLLIVGRGGGSLEDLQAFNSEQVARAVFASKIPIISAVGHETDFTICDLVADIRAATPTAAAEMAVPDQQTLVSQLKSVFSRLQQSLYYNLQSRQQQLDYANAKLIHPATRLNTNRQQQRILKDQILHHTRQSLSRYQVSIQRLQHRLLSQSPQNRILKSHNRHDQLRNQLRNRLDQVMQACQYQLQGKRTALSALSPQGTLERGFAILQTQTGKVITHNDQVSGGDTIRATLANGKLEVQVKRGSQT